MTLSFSEMINGKPSCFIDKIWEGLTSELTTKEFTYKNYWDKYFEIFGRNWDNEILSDQKITTIREDESNRWKAGNDIHFVINNRRPNRFQFAPVVKCVSAQKIEIQTLSTPFYPCRYSIDSNNHKLVMIDDKIVFVDIIKEIAINDGFDTVEDFFGYFDKDFTGKIIHWTDLKY
jgi:uncharacterized protein YqfB (UPF0267 family)